MLLFLLETVLCEFVLKQTIWPEDASDDSSYFGNSVAMSSNYVLIGAEYLNITGVKHPNEDKTGALYIYRYNSTTDTYQLIEGNTNGLHRLQPQVDNVDYLPGTFASDVRVADDPARILVGAPYTYVKSDILNDVPVFNESLQKDWSDEEIYYTHSNSENYTKEIGALYVYSFDAQSQRWNELKVSIPNEIVYLGGYGRVLTMSEGMNKFAGAYFNKLRPGRGLPPTIGCVFVSYFDDNGNVQMYPPIEPFEEMTQPDYQRFGAQLRFMGQNQLLIVCLDQSTEGPNMAGTYTYDLRNGERWEYSGKIDFQGSSDYSSYGTTVDVRNDNNNYLIAMSAEHNDGSNRVILISSTSTGQTPPQQIINTGTYAPETLHFCGQYLAIKFDYENTTVAIYRQNENLQYELFQTITDPKLVKEGLDNIDYESMGVRFPGQFAWEPTCSKFVIGSQSGEGGGLDRESLPYGRAYIYQFDDSPNPDTGGPDDSDNNNGPKGNDPDVGLIAGVTVAAVVVVVVIIVVIIVVVRKRSLKDKNTSEN